MTIYEYNPWSDDHIWVSCLSGLGLSAIMALRCQLEHPYLVAPLVEGCNWAWVGAWVRVRVGVGVGVAVYNQVRVAGGGVITSRLNTSFPVPPE